MTLRDFRGTFSAAAPWLALCALGCSSSEPGDSYSTQELAASAAGGSKLQATLSGENEVPGPGDPDGSGTARLTLNSGQETLCYELSVENVGPVTGAHVHVAPPGEAGPIVVDLQVQSSEPACDETDLVLTASDGGAGDEFGRALALEDGTALIGAEGAAYVFVRDNGSWSELQRLTDAEPEFGSAVALSGDTAAVAADGEVYLYVRSGDTWVLQQVLAPPDGEAQDFGVAVALSGDRLLVGAPSDNESPYFGSVYVFERNESDEWTEQTRLRAEFTGGAFGCFGCAVALSGDTALVGIPEANQRAEGSVVGFELVGGTWQAFGLPWTTTAGGMLGAAVALSGDTALVGAPGHWVFEGPNLIDFGTVEAFGRTNGDWAPQLMISDTVFARFPDSLTAEEVLPSLGGGGFGASVALFADTAAIGAPAEESAYVFGREGDRWRQLERLTAGGELAVGFGAAVAIDAVSLLVGAPGDDATRGAVFVFGADGSPVCDLPLQEFEGCVDADRELLKAIRKDPAQYYVNVHTAEFPAGAVRGQLGR